MSNANNNGTNSTNTANTNTSANVPAESVWVQGPPSATPTNPTHHRTWGPPDAKSNTSPVNDKGPTGSSSPRAYGPPLTQAQASNEAYRFAQQAQQAHHQQRSHAPYGAATQHPLPPLYAPATGTHGLGSSPRRSGSFSPFSSGAGWKDLDIASTRTRHSSDGETGASDLSPTVATVTMSPRNDSGGSEGTQSPSSGISPRLDGSYRPNVRSTSGSPAHRLSPRVSGGIVASQANTCDASVAAFLNSIGLARYMGNFSDHEIEWRQLCMMNDALLERIGIQAIGARLRILSAVSAILTSSVMSWTVADVGQFVQKIGIPQAKLFIDHGIDGRTLLELTSDELRQDLQMTTLNDRKCLHASLAAEMRWPVLWQYGQTPPVLPSNYFLPLHNLGGLLTSNISSPGSPRDANEGDSVSSPRNAIGSGSFNSMGYAVRPKVPGALPGAVAPSTALRLFELSPRTANDFVSGTPRSSRGDFYTNSLGQFEPRKTPRSGGGSTPTSDMSPRNTSSSNTTQNSSSKSSSGGSGPTTPREKPNFFLSLRVDSVEIRRSIERVQHKIEEKYPDLGTAMVPLERAHITLFVLCLSSDATLERAQSVLASCQDIMDRYFPDPRVRFQGLGHVRNTLVWSGITDQNQKIQLMAFGGAIKQRFQEAGLVSFQVKVNTPHITIMKNPGPHHRKPKLRIPREAYEEFASVVFGEQSFACLELSAMDRPMAADGYYPCFGKVFFSSARPNGPRFERGSLSLGDPVPTDDGSPIHQHAASQSPRDVATHLPLGSSAVGAGRRSSGPIIPPTRSPRLQPPGL